MSNEKQSFYGNSDIVTFFKTHREEFKKMYEKCKNERKCDCEGFFKMIKNQSETNSSGKGGNKQDMKNIKSYRPDSLIIMGVIMMVIGILWAGNASGLLVLDRSVYKSLFALLLVAWGLSIIVRVIFKRKKWNEDK